MATAKQVHEANVCIWEARETMMSMFQAEDIAMTGGTENYVKFSVLAHKGRLEVKKQLKYARELLEA